MIAAHHKLPARAGVEGKNIDEIVNAVYQQGLGDGQRGLVERTANVSAQTPQDNQEQRTSNVTQQLADALGMGNNTLTFKI